jgi:hypothetical protein
MDENQQKVLQYLFQNPQTLSQLGMVYRPTQDQSNMDAANNMDFGKLSTLSRLFGIEITPNTRVSEDFGALQAMRRR